MVVLALSGIAIAVLVALLATGVLREKPIPPLPAAPVETAEVKFREAAAAYNGPPAEESDPQVKAIVAAFAKLRSSVASGDKQAFVDAIDFERLFQESMRTTRNKIYDAGMQRRFVKDLKAETGKRVLGFTDTLTSDLFEVSHCHILPGANEAVAYVRIKGTTNRLKYRWWLIQRDGQWKFFDYEDFDCGNRWSHAMSAHLDLAGNDRARSDRMNQQADLLSEAGKAFSTEDADQIDRRLDAIQIHELIPEDRALLYLYRGTNLATRGKYREAIVEYDRANEELPGMVRLNLSRGAAYNNLQQYGAARVELESYLNSLGRDAEAYEHLGNALEGLNLRDEALAAYRQGLDDDPLWFGNFYRLAALLPAESKAEIGERFAKMKPTAAHFDTLYFGFRWQDPAALAEIAKQYALIAPRQSQTGGTQSQRAVSKERL